MSKKQKKIFWPMLLAVLVCVGALALVAARTRSLSSPTEIGVPIGIKPIPQASVMPSPRGAVQNIRFTVYDVGIYPRQLRIKQGLIGISIEDRTGSSAGLVIEREDGNLRLPIGQVMRLVNESRGRNRLPLEPGRYRISNATHRTNEAELIVEP